MNLPTAEGIIAMCKARLLVLALSALPALGQSLPADWHVDKTLYPKAYGLLDNEQLMFPVDMSDWPVRIDGAHQLFVDDYLMASAENITRQVHPARKHPANPVMRGEHPWEGIGPMFPIVRRDEKTGRFRMWYAGWTRYTLASGVSARFPTLYAESEDGIRWSKPQLGLHAYEGSKANNIIIPAGNLYGLIIDANDPDPNRRYKGIVWHEPQYVAREGYYLYTSPDGLHWSRAREEPLAISLLGYAMPQTGIGDTSVFRWDERLRRYVGDVKFVLPGKFRCRGMMESDDLIHWTRPRMTLYPDALDAPDSQVYGHLSFAYESMWLGFLRMMHTQRVGWKQTTVELTASRDGRHWTRVGRREEFIPLGGPDDWDADYHEPTWDPILVGDDLWIYYRSARALERDPKRPNGIGLAMVRRDGFVSLNAGQTPGVVLTRPLAVSGNALFISAEILPDGWIKAAFVEPGPGGKPIENYSLDDAVPVTKGGVQLPVTWKNASTFKLPANAQARLKFQMANAKLYAFWIQ